MNISRVVWDDDCVRFLTNSHAELIRYFKDLVNPEGPRAESWDNRTWNEVSAVWCFIYDDRYSVEMEMGGDLIVLDKETDELIEDDWWEFKPGLTLMPLDIKEYLSLNGEYQSEWIKGVVGNV